MNLEELVTQLRTEKADCLARAASFADASHKAETEAELLAARIQGIEEARAALASWPASAVLSDGCRKPRRDIRGMVRAEMDESPWLLDQPEHSKVKYLAEKYQCRPSQIYAALRSIERQDAASWVSEEAREARLAGADA